MKWREWSGKSCWLDATTPEVEVVDELAEYVAYFCAARGNRETMIAVKLVAVNLVLEQWMKRLLPLDHSRIEAVKEGIKRAHVEGDIQQRARIPLSWEMMKRMEGAAKEWKVGGIVAWIELALTYLIPMRSSELLAEDDGSVHAVYCLGG